MIKRARLLKGLTQHQLSEITGISQSYISKLEKPYFVHSPTITQIISISKALDIDIVNLARYFIIKELNNF
ncbi:helix-turn-helix transcriptional regulator [Paraclostridium bifermentans]|uniref:helix-turn-helix domain-containing protein n=1 Tax=Paraclostridium bifermentans TaxID=1490 RepID=UPI001C127EAF|nr:helix-turn-helix transcriptional regulator [Paraclostridium bifermentans]MBU5290101.1 helix-turn-helix transcriptional regulator [Paraclostridium bifermentans]